MEYSPMMVVMLWALTPSDCWPTGTEPGEQARVVEMPQPIMSVHPEGGYFTFNHGRPFLAERDPLTGAVDSNIKTTPVTSDDYLYEEYEESGESIDRKDSTKIYSRNDIISPSKDSDLHKFLNLPVHYSSSGKFPLISSSYANTKVQGHGPLSNHKLYSSSSSTTTTTVSPSYYPLKTTAPSTLPAKLAANTITTTTSTTTPRLATTQLPTTAATTSTTPKTTTIRIPPTSKTISTTTTKPPLPSYEYEYEYDYDKSDGESTEKSSHDYEFLGASSEVTKSYEKFSTVSSSKLPSLPTITTLTSSSTSSHTTESPSTVSVSNITGNNSPKEALSASEVNILSSVITPLATTEKTRDSPFKKTNVSKVSQEDTFDLRPPTPELPIELRPPQLHPTRPYSATLPTKQSFGHPGFVKYPEPQVTILDKKPVHFYLPFNTTNTKDEVDQTKLTKLDGTLDKENHNNSSQPKPFVVHFTQKTPLDKPSIGENGIPITTTKKYDQLGLEFDKSTRHPIKDETYSINSQERPIEIQNSDKIRPHSQSTLSHISSGNIDKNKGSIGNGERPNINPVFEQKRPQGTITMEQTRQEDQISEHIKYHALQSKPEFMKPQEGFSSESSKLHGMILTGPTGSSPQEPRPHVQNHAKPLVSLYENTKSSIPTPETKRPQRPQGLASENSRLPSSSKPENSRPQSSHFPPNNKPHHAYYNTDYSRPQNFHLTEFNRPQSHPFGLRINEKPSGSEINRPQVIEHLRLHGMRIPDETPQAGPLEQKKPVSEIDGRPPQGLSTDVRPESSSQSVFPKPQSGKRPDYNTVQFGQPSKVENHFISVSPGHENPSYSLQTSFSIGIPPPEQKQTSSGGHGVGQVLFPDEEPEKRPPIWPHHQRPPQITQSDSPLEKYPRPPWESHLKPPQIYHKKEQYSSIKRKPLPNILPQFRPNAKIGHAEPHVYLKPREPFDTLQPPPLPRPQFLRLEQEIEDTKPLVHRRNGQGSTRVTTLQMMQGSPTSKRASLRIDDSNEKNEPVFVVYPSNGGSAPPPSPQSDGVVVGTRGPQRPLPPDNLDIADDLDSFSLDNNKNFQARIDTPVLKSKSTSKPTIKNDFPYTLITPNSEDRSTPVNVVTKEYTAFSPTVPSIENDHDTEINIIPYLQDYMPFATKKPQHKDTWLLGTEMKTSVGVKKAEIAQSSHKNENHRVVSEGPQPQDFQAPFHASLTAPSQGWSVVQKKPTKEKPNEEITTTKDLSETQTTEEPKFDIQNFKPQLFGGFKPIVPPVENENKEKLQL